MSAGRLNIPARPTTYKGIQMRSRLEAQIAGLMDKHDMVWEYEPRCYASERGQYLPDFAILWPNMRWSYVEVKPPLNEAELLAVADRMSIIWESEPEAHLMVLMDDDGIFEARHRCPRSPIGSRDIWSRIVGDHVLWQWVPHNPVPELEPEVRLVDPYGFIYTYAPGEFLA